MMLCHALSDEAGRFVDADDAFCELLQRPKRELLATTILDITHPDDRIDNKAKLYRLMEQRISFTIEKRYTRPAEAPVWVENHVSAFLDNGRVRPVATIRLLSPGEAAIAQRKRRPLAPGAFPRVSPVVAREARKAQLFRQHRRTARLAQVLNTPAYEMLLELVASEGAGHPVDLDALCEASGVSPAIGRRWIKVLEQLDLVELPRGWHDEIAAVRLTLEGGAEMTRFLDRH
jgi:DNA-binding MarR family transcriptional regulator